MRLAVIREPGEGIRFEFTVELVDEDDHSHLISGGAQSTMIAAFHSLQDSIRDTLVHATSDRLSVEWREA